MADDVLPGLDDLDPVEAKRASALSAAVRASIVALNDADLIAPRDAARLQLALTMADVIEDKRRTGRMSTVGNDARVLMDLLDKLTPRDENADESTLAAIKVWNAGLETFAASLAPAPAAT